jgi:hypothetical protein
MDNRKHDEYHDESPEELCDEVVAIRYGRADSAPPLHIRTTGQGTTWQSAVSRGSRTLYVTPTVSTESDARRLAEAFVAEARRREAEITPGQEEAALAEARKELIRSWNQP